MAIKELVRNHFPMCACTEDRQGRQGTSEGILRVLGDLLFEFLCSIRDVILHHVLKVPPSFTIPPSG